MKASEFLTENRATQIELDENLTKSFLAEFRYALELAEDGLNQHRVKDTTIPAGPDTSKFRAGVMGSAELVDNYAHYADGAVRPTVFKYFLKIGSGLPDAAVKSNISRAMHYIGDVLEDYEIGPNSFPVFVDFENGYRVSIVRVYGTNFGGIGIDVWKK